MGNTIGCNDVAILSKPGPSEIDKGSIIIFKTPSTDCKGYGDLTTMHRVTGITIRNGLPYFQTKGDGNAYSDPCQIPFDVIQYKVIGLIYDGAVP